MHHRILAAATFVIAGCASPQPASEPDVAPAAAAPAQAATAPTTSEYAKKQGYRVVERDGETYYCYEELRLGSRVAQRTICLTEAELEAVRQGSKENLERIQRNPVRIQGG
jgi:putative hemolysin